ncbi:MAG: glycosyltransferase family 39 protein [Anaerolineae bacterium]
MAITLLAAVLRLTHLGSKSFWFDECFTYTVTLASLKDSLSALLVAGIYSPLYFLLLRPVTALAGTSEYAFRFLSAAFGLLAVPVIYRLGLCLTGRATGVVAALLLALCPFHIWYSQDARTYAPMLFFGLLAMERFILLLRGRRKWGSFALCSALAYPMHYIAFSLLYVQLVYLVPRLRQTRLVRRWFLAQVVAGMPLLPWLVLYLVRGVRPAGLSWIPRPGPLAPLYTLWNMTTGDAETFTLPVVVLALGVGVVFWRGLLSWDRARRLLAWWLALPVGFLFLLSLRRPFYVDRYLMASLPAYLLLLALGIVTWRKVTYRLLAGAVVVLALGWGTCRLYTDPYFAKEDWRGAALAVESELERGDIVVLEDPEALLGTSVYRTREWPYVVLESGREREMLEQAMARHSRAWLVWRSPYESNHRLSKSAPFDLFAVAPPSVRAWLEAHRDRVGLDLRLPGLSVVRVDGGER